MSDDDDFDDGGFACQPKPLRPSAKRLKSHQHRQHTFVEFDGPYGPIRIESVTTVTIEVIEDDWPPRPFDERFRQPSLTRLPKARKR